MIISTVRHPEISVCPIQSIYSTTVHHPSEMAFLVDIGTGCCANYMGSWEPYTCLSFAGLYFCEMSPGRLVCLHIVGSGHFVCFLVFRRGHNIRFPSPCVDCHAATGASWRLARLTLAMLIESVACWPSNQSVQWMDIRTRR